MSNLPVRIILRLNEGSDGTLALRAARSLMASEHRDCVYGYSDGSHIWARRNKSSITAYEMTRGPKASPRRTLQHDPPRL